MAQITDGSAVFNVKQVNADKATTVVNNIISNLNSGVIGSNICYVGTTNSTTDNNRQYNWNGIITISGGVDVVQMCLPVSTKYRVAVRGQGNVYNNPITTGWKELAYTDEVPMLSDNGNNTKKITVDRLEGTADRSKGLQSENVGVSNRPTTANIPALNNSSVRYYLATASMEKAKPTGGDGVILHFGWDNSAFDSQLFIPNNAYSTNHMQWRYQKGSPDWSNATDWRSVAWLDEVVTLNGNNTVTGTLQVKTQATSDSSDNVATTQFVKNAIAAALAEKGL